MAISTDGRPDEVTVLAEAGVRVRDLIAMVSTLAKTPERDVLLDRMHALQASLSSTLDARYTAIEDLYNA